MRDEAGGCITCHHPIASHPDAGGPWKFCGFFAFTKAEVQNLNFQNQLFLQEPLIGPFPLGGLFDPAVLQPLIPYLKEISGCTPDFQVTPSAIMFLASNPKDPACGELAQGSRNDALLNVLTHACKMTLIRNVQATSLDGKTSPVDISLYCCGVPLLIAEETSDNLQAAAADLDAKFAWIACLVRLPFVINFAFSFTQFGIYRIGVHDQTHAQIFQSNLNTVPERWNCLKAVINVARMINYLAERGGLTPSWFEFDREYTNPVGMGSGITKTIKIQVPGVRVRYNNQPFYHRMKLMYQNCLEAGVPRAEEMHYFDDSNLSFVLRPVGATRTPCIAKELVLAMIHILQALVAFHEIGYVHTDIGWRNVIIDIEGNWRLIDFTRFCSKTSEDNANRAQRVTSFQTSQEPCVRRSLMPYGGNHWTARHDYYQVGRLITECAVHYRLVEQQLGMQLETQTLKAINDVPDVIPTAKDQLRSCLLSLLSILLCRISVITPSIMVWDGTKLRRGIM